jgi:hypothetical protein
MEASLQGLLDLAGVNAAMVVDAGGRLVGHRGKAVYDASLCEQVGGPLSRAVDSIQLQHQDWESTVARFADGTLLLRNLGAVGGTGYVLVVVADATLNPAFATVAIRVASNKLRRTLEGGSTSGPIPSGVSSSAGHPAARSSQTLPPPPTSHPAAGSRPALASSGLSWSKTSGSGVFSAVGAADPASSAWLGRVARELARFVGPMAKVYVEEATRRVSPDQPFAMAASKALLDDLCAQVQDGKDREAFLKAAEAAKSK